eukprot:Selendium_serpulae@DN7896_c0_g1_i2.p1
MQGGGMSQMGGGFDPMAAMQGGMGADMSGMMGMGMPVQLNRLTLNPTEVPFYQNLFMMADPHGTGCIGGAEGAQFLSQCGLPRPVLHQVWMVADPTNQGFLDMEGFFVACRLVAHAQNGYDPTPEIVIQEPATLPNFEVVTRPAHSELDSVGGAMASGFGELGAGMDPNNAAVGMPGGGDGWSDMMSVQGTPMASTGGLSFLVTADERNKYVAKFHESDGNADGFVEADEAKMVMSASGLPDADLAQIWSAADADGDGRLAQTEFIAAMKMISCRRKGSAIPGRGQLPAELSSSLVGGMGASLALTGSALFPTGLGDATADDPFTSGAFGATADSKSKTDKPTEFSLDDFASPPSDEKSEKKSKGKKGRRGKKKKKKKKKYSALI